MRKSKFLVINILFALTVSILAILFGNKPNFWAFYKGGWVTATPDELFEGSLVTVAFLVAWFLYGIVIGYKKKEGFMKFISLYWGIGGSICLIAGLIAPIGKFAIIVLPIDILIFVPTYVLAYFFSVSSNSTPYLVPIVSMILSWSAGTIGYLLGYILTKLRGSKLSAK